MAPRSTASFGNRRSPLPGHNSPIVWGDRIFLSGATADKEEVYCFSADKGELLWTKPVAGPVHGADLTLSEDTGYAPSTLATDGRRVFAMFPTGDLAALNFQGKKLWSMNLGKPKNTYGLAASLVTFQNRLIVQFDQGIDPDEGKSSLIAFDGPTGKKLWSTARAVSASWTSPIVIYPPNLPPQIITAAKPLVASYDANTGQELWHADELTGDVAPSPAYAGDRVFAAEEASQLVSLKLGGKGDIANSPGHWTATDGLPDIISPLATDKIRAAYDVGGVAYLLRRRHGKQALGTRHPNILPRIPHPLRRLRLPDRLQRRDAHFSGPA